MIKVYKIVTIIFVLIVICAPSCGDEQAANREEAILNDAKTNIRTEFEFDYLMEASLFAFEKTATQKLSDFADYFHIMSDTSLDMSFRQKASEMIKSTFQSENITLQLTNQDNVLKNGIEVRLLIKKGLENSISFPPFIFDSIRIHEPLHRIENNMYSGSLISLQKFTNPNQSKQLLKSLTREVDFYVLKQDKIFGTDTLNIWNVRLGEIR